jgi:regulator of protease activity HflC (stomatin/prohibitin superfamily)
VLIALLLAYSTFSTQALVVRLGQPVRVITEPGLNAKIPLIDSDSVSTNAAKSRHRSTSEQCPLFPRKWTFTSAIGM